MTTQVWAASNERLNTEIPGWEDGSTKEAIRKYGLEHAELTEKDYENLYDHRLVKILNKARLYDEMNSKSNIAQKRVQAVPPKTLTSGTSQTNAQADDFNARKRAALRSGDSHRIAKIMEELL